MIVLDENIPAGQRQLLQRWRIHARQIGVDLGRRGMQDEEIIPFLHSLRRPTFFTRDEDFHAREFCHPRVCLVYLAVDKHEVASFVRRFLKLPSYSSQAKRMGAVVRLSSAGLAVWRLHSAKVSLHAWD